VWILMKQKEGLEVKALVCCVYMMLRKEKPEGTVGVSSQIERKCVGVVEGWRRWQWERMKEFIRGKM